MLRLPGKDIRLGSNRRIELPTEAVLSPVVFVTGPRRSGTAVIGRLLAETTGRTYVGETAFGVTDYQRMTQRAGRKSPCIVQAPALAPRILDLPDDWLIVMVRRSLEEIRRSCESIKVPVRPENLGEQYRERFPHCDLPANASDAEMIYWAWEKEQEPRLSYPFEVSYETVATHPLVVFDDSRVEATVKRVAASPPVSEADAKGCKPCSCSGPGYCDRHKRQKTPHLWKLCKTNPKYRVLWDKQCPDSRSSS